MKNFFPFICLLALISIYSVDSTSFQRGRGFKNGMTTSTTSTPSPSESSSTVPSEGSSSTWRPSRPARRFSPPTTTRAPGQANNDLIRKGLIEKLCAKKNGDVSTTIATSTLKPDSDTSPASTTKRSRSLFARSRPARAAQAATSTVGPTCSDFDSLSFEELTNKVKAGLKPVGRRMRA